MDALTFVAVLRVGDREIWLAPAQVGFEVAVRALDGVAVIWLLAGQARELGESVEVT